MVEVNRNKMNRKKPGHQVLMSNGGLFEILQFLNPQEFTKMQLVNTYCYNIAVGRAQTRIAIACIIKTG